MEVFYQTFFSHPNAEWRYILGYEAAFMPPEDLKIFQNIQWNNEAWKSFDPWVTKMRPEDRLWITQAAGTPKPDIGSLEWVRLTSYIWSGRKTISVPEKPLIIRTPDKS